MPTKIAAPAGTRYPQTRPDPRLWRAAYVSPTVVARPVDPHTFQTWTWRTRAAHTAARMAQVEALAAAHAARYGADR